jgi:3-hydroxyisobutyrate dehydrogenase-like beta-hydroxyacid dehydrogenase
MGANMARRLQETGFNITAVLDHKPAVATALGKELNAEACTTLARVTELSDIVFTVVVDDASMKAIFTAQGDNLLMGAKGRTFINCATVSPAIHVLVDQLARKVGARSLEACMASSITQARNGTLYLMVGGRKDHFFEIEPVLKPLTDDGKLLRFIGAPGKAAQVKALVNMVMNINTAGLAEGLALGHALGIDLSMLRSVFAETGAGSRVLVTDGEDMQKRDHACFFSAAHAAKDSGIALALGNQQKLNLPLAKAAKKQFDTMVKLGLGELDKSGVAELTFKGRGPKAAVKPKAKAKAK